MNHPFNMPNLSIDASKLENSFDRIAKELFNDYTLQIGEDAYQLTEIEFYYNKFDPNNPYDNFAHQHGEAYPNGTWRLHGAGLDIVLKKMADYYGGILLRGIQKLDSNGIPLEDGIIDGPWNTATACIRGNMATDPKASFYLKKMPSSKERTFKKSPRVGLFLKNTEDLEYICKPWRYSTMPIHTKKYRHLIFLQLHHEGDKYKDQVVASVQSQDNYLDYFKEGKTMDTADFVGINNTVPNTCRLFGHYISKQL